MRRYRAPPARAPALPRTPGQWRLQPSRHTAGERTRGGFEATPRSWIRRSGHGVGRSGQAVGPVTPICYSALHAGKFIAHDVVCCDATLKMQNLRASQTAVVVKLTL